ncbi:Glyoxylase, beta-lactamase superfamily II [Modestobacter sp. DSM 44400]|nr:Glyoxylase, beta-lactamase superfamily II [Modestobacter sp. DSM 44400]
MITVAAGWTEVGDRVFVRRHAALDLNCGLVAGDGRCLVVDTRSHLAEGRALAEAVRTVTPYPWAVVNTHAHLDHCFGNAAFRPADVWGSRRCADELAATGDLQRAAVVAGLLAADEVEAGLMAAAPIDPPDRLVDDVAELDIGGRAVTLRHLGRGHTDGDLVVAVDDILFAGDLVEEGAPPAMGDAFPLEWPDTLDALLAMARGPVVPGHGAVVTAGYVAVQQSELAQLARWLTDPGAAPVFDARTRADAPVEGLGQPAHQRQGQHPEQAGDRAPRPLGHVGPHRLPLDGGGQRAHTGRQVDSQPEATASGSSTSSSRRTTRMPGCWARSSSRNTSRRSSRRAMSARSRPRAANSRAMPRPRPVLAPVMKIR